MGVGEGQEALIRIWGKMEEEERGHMAKHEKPHQFDLDRVYGWFGEHYKAKDVYKIQ